jgi:putative transposase
MLRPKQLSFDDGGPDASRTRAQPSVIGRARGRVWGDRYHRRELTNARQVRNALVYCINNYKKHFSVVRGAPRIDGCSSARWFQGWVTKRLADDGPRPPRSPS